MKVWLTDDGHRATARASPTYAWAVLPFNPPSGLIDSSVRPVWFKTKKQAAVYAQRKYGTHRFLLAKAPEGIFHEA